VLFKKGELKHLWPFYLYILVYGVSTMILPFFVLYFLNLGFSYFQVAVITAAQGFSMFLFEIPTGGFADGFSRKYSVALGFGIVAIAVTLIPFTHNFYLITFLWALTGVGMTFSSGAEEALVIANLNKANRMDLHHEYFIKFNSFNALGSIFAPIIGAILVKNHSISILWYVFGLGFFLNAVIVLLFAKEHFEPQKIKAIALIKKSYHNSKMGIAFTIRHKVIFLSILAGVFIDLMMVGNIGMQPLLVSLGMKEHQLGYLYSISAAVGIGMSFLSRRFVRYKPKNVMSVVVFMVMVLLLCLLFVHPPYFYLACLIFILRGGLFSLGMPLFYPYLHRFIPEKIRATTMSAKSMADQAATSIGYIGAGALIDLFGPQKVLALGGLFGIVVIVLYQKIKD
jgi:MFS family permease